MNRRHLLQRLAGLGSGLLLPATVEENAEAVRRYWALDRTMVPLTWDFWLRGPAYTAAPFYEGVAVNRTDSRVIDLMVHMPSRLRPTYEGDPLQWILNPLPGINRVGRVTTLG
jgi:hypothetical protein